MAEPHVLLFPYPLQGHINPMVSFGQRLASEGSVLVTVVHSASNFAQLHNNNQHQQQLLGAQAIPDHSPIADPADAASDEHSVRRLEGGLRNLLATYPHPVSCLVADMLMPWTRDLASQFGIPWIPLCIFPAFTLAIALHLPDLIAKGYLPLPPQPGTEGKLIDFLPGLPPFRAADIPMDFWVHDLTHLRVIMNIVRPVKEAAGLLVNSCYDLERSALDALRAQLQIPIYTVGPLLLNVGSNQTTLPTSASLLTEDVNCLKWLDHQPDCSVVYAAFGSLSSLSPKEIQELALGLEASHQRFLWVIRNDSVTGAGRPDILPEGFLSRTKDTGLVISWAPQLAVLSHRAVGGFFTHCGWSSVLESLLTGIPMIGCPQLSDQNTILKLVIDWKVGMPLEDPEKKTEITREAVETAVRALMHGEEGQEGKRRAVELGQKMRQAVSKGGNSDASLKMFVEDLKLIRDANSKE